MSSLLVSPIGYTVPTVVDGCGARGIVAGSGAGPAVAVTVTAVITAGGPGRTQVVAVHIKIVRSSSTNYRVDVGNVFVQVVIAECPGRTSWRPVSTRVIFRD